MLGDGVSSFRYSCLAVSNRFKADARAFRAISRSRTAQSRFARSRVTFGSSSFFCAEGSFLSVQSFSTQAELLWSRPGIPGIPPSSASSVVPEVPGNEKTDDSSRSPKGSLDISPSPKGSPPTSSSIALNFMVGSRPSPPTDRTNSASASIKSSPALLSRINACRCLSFAACQFSDSLSRCRTSRAGKQVTTHPSPSTVSSFIFVFCTISVLIHARRLSISCDSRSCMNDLTALAFLVIHPFALCNARVLWCSASPFSWNPDSPPRPSTDLVSPFCSARITARDEGVRLKPFTGGPSPASSRGVKTGDLFFAPVLVSAEFMALKIPMSSFCFRNELGIGAVVSMGMSFTTTAWLLIPKRVGPSFQINRAYALVSRDNRYIAQNETSHISRITTQNTFGCFAASMVNRFMPPWPPLACSDSIQ
mmetsp:Transcript_8034/g.26673  ORF Transcript_8034/g.26673 Transcript_8034/m.26673 type:complete len:422 (-) Transcript_8034:790-2055(-)